MLLPRDTPTWKSTEDLFTLLQPKESELHCTDLAAHSLKHMNLLVVLEILSVNMIHLDPQFVGLSDSSAL